MGSPRALISYDHLFQRRLGGGWIEALKRIVGAELDDDAAGILRQRPIEPGEPRRRRVSRDAGIDHLHLLSARLQRLLELGGEGFVLGKAESSGQTIAEGNDHRRARRRPISMQGRGEKHP